MGSDSGTIVDDSRKKHRRSSDVEAEEITKRRKHKHHHHRHHHRSKKREGEERVVEDEVYMEVGELPTVVAELKKDYDDMEEGEIVEEDGEKLATNNLLAVDSPDSAGSLRVQMDQIDGDRQKMKKVMDNDLASIRGSVNGNDDVTISDGSDEKYKKSVRSPHQSRIPDELGFSKNSGSNHPLDRSGSQSRSDVENVDSLKIAHLQDWDINRETNRNYANESDEEIRFRHDDSEHFRGSRSKVLEDEREPSVYYSSHADRPNSKYAKDTSHRYLDDGDVDRVHNHERERGSSRDERREKDRKKSRNRDHGKERSRVTDREEDRHKEWDADEKVVNGTESDLATDRDRKHGREREKDKITRNTSERVRHRDTDVVDRRKEREGDQYRNKDRDKVRERERSLERARDRDRARQRDISLDRSRDRKKKGNDSEGKSKDWSTEVDRHNERVGERGREGSHRERVNGRDRSRDRYWDDGHQNYNGTSSKQDWRSEYTPDGTSHRHNKDRRKTDDPSRVDSCTNSAGDSDDARKREEEEHEEYEEKISLQLAEEEEDDVERIKEESRRRRQAILEKYKNMKLQDKSEPHPGNDQEKLPILQTELLISTSEVANGKTGDSLDVAKSPVEMESAAEHTGPRGLGEGTPKSEKSDDMFCDDIFGETPTDSCKPGKGGDLPVVRSGLHDNWDDADGYYSYRFGELLDGRYEITAAHGKGVFSSVVRAKDLKAGPGEPEEVAIKIIRNNETMFKAGQSELIILKKLVGADPEDRRHCVRFLSSFKYRNHLCLVFESLHMNLREVLKKFGRNIGLKLTAVRAYAKQLLIALKHLRNCGVLHCDIKPDNMLVNESKNVLKLCDFGNAMFAGKNEITPYLVSRFYRAPEIILGLTYDHPVDMWSIGCCLYELYSGKVLFPGATNNDMLRLHLELKGPFPKKMLRKGAFIEQHFDQDLNFISLEDDPVTKKTIKRVLVNIKPKDIGSIITGSAGEDPKMLTNFKDLLDKIFTLDPDKRMTVSQALTHPFITGK